MRQAAVLHAIQSIVDDTNRAMIDSMDDPKSAYDALIVQHGSDDGFTAANTLTELFSTTYDPSTSMNDYLARIQDLHSRVRDLTSSDPDLKISDKLFAVVLVNSLPRSKYGTVVQQLLATIKTLTMPQVTARLRLKAASMATDKARFKNVYAAKMTNQPKLKPGNKPTDLCHVHPNGRHTNSACFQKKNKTAASASNTESLSDEEMVKRYKTMMNIAKGKPQPKPSSLPSSAPPTAAAATTVDATAEEQYITYSAYNITANPIHTVPNQFLLDTGANTHISHDHNLMHDVVSITPVYINGIAGMTGRVTATKRGSVNIICVDTSGNRRLLEVKNVLLVPESGVNLLAVSSLTKEGGIFSGDNTHIKIVN